MQNQLEVYSIYDSAMQNFKVPFFMINQAVAIRTFTNLVEDSNNVDIHNHPQEFSLFHIGKYDALTGKIESIQPTCVYSGNEAVIQINENKKYQLKGNLAEQTENTNTGE